jgi:hypothetical protein
MMQVTASGSPAPTHPLLLYTASRTDHRYDPILMSVLGVYIVPVVSAGLLQEGLIIFCLIEGGLYSGLRIIRAVHKTEKEETMKRPPFSVQ